MGRGRRMWLFLCALAFVLCGCAMWKRRSGDTVKVCGKVYYEEYAGGTVTVYWRRDLSRGAPRPENRPAFVRRIPGEYCLEVPRGTRFFISAKCTPPRPDVRHQSDGYFCSEQLVADGDRVQDVRLERRKRLMDSYKGPVVRISGRVIHEGYSRGAVGVTVETPDNHRKNYLPPDITQCFLLAPGNFTLEVPAGIGDVYINGLNYPETDLRTVAGDKAGVVLAGYSGNPVNVGNSDIQGVDIFLSGNK